MDTIAFPLIYLMVALNTATGQWEDQGALAYRDQKTCLAARQAIVDSLSPDWSRAGNYFCLAYKDTRYMMEVLQTGPFSRGRPTPACPAYRGVKCGSVQVPIFDCQPALPLSQLAVDP
jgi:hypothetical protein